MRCVLLIDDDRVGLRIREYVLRSAGYRVITAETGLAGVELAAAECVDLVVLDYRLPCMPGSGVLQHIRTSRPDLPVVLLSGMLDIPANETWGASAVLVKGDGPQRLLQTLGKYLPTHRAA